jgi:peroxiredoxin
MNNKVGIVSMVVILGLVGAVTVASLSSRSPLPAGPAPAVASSAAETQQGDGLAEDAYSTLRNKLDELESKARSERSMDRRVDIIKQMDVMLSEFIDEYAGTPQASEAAFDAGIVSFGLQKPEKAVRYLEIFLHNSEDPPRDKQAYAHFYLAEAYKQAGKYEDAEAEYKTILASFSDVDPKLASMAQQSLAMLASERRLKVGAEPIKFEVTSITGEKLSPQMYKGRVLLLDFWATWCGPCLQEMPNVIDVYKKYKKDGFEIVGISLDRNRSALDRYLEKNDIKWPQYYDGKFWNNEVSTLYGVKAIPATFLIDKKGKIRYKTLRGRQLEVAVKELLAE